MARNKLINNHNVALNTAGDDPKLPTKGQIGYVDLGLSSGTKWANMNIGATKETDCGLFFQWGGVLLGMTKILRLHIQVGQLVLVIVEQIMMTL